jgi:protein SCO1/2
VALGRLARALGAAAGAAAQRFFGGGGFPAFALSLLAFFELLLLSLLLAPVAPGGFAEEFRIWCFGWDPATGSFELGLVLSMTTPPLFFGAILLLLWWQPLQELARRRVSLALHAAAAAVVVGATAGAFAALSGPPETGELPFPAEALRTAHRPPSLHLTNQLGADVDLAELRGRVVLLTAVYEQCSRSCPAILERARRAVEEQPAEARADLRVIGVTLDPEHDEPEKLLRLARRHGLEPPLYQLVTGAPADVEAVLDAMSVARRRDARTGVIDHANLFLLIDRHGRIAYRLALGPRHERWLDSALRVLLDEPLDAG